MPTPCSRRLTQTVLRIRGSRCNSHTSGCKYVRRSILLCSEEHVGPEFYSGPILPMTIAESHSAITDRSAIRNQFSLYAARPAPGVMLTWRRMNLRHTTPAHPGANMRRTAEPPPHTTRYQRRCFQQLRLVRTAGRLEGFGPSLGWHRICVDVRHERHHPVLSARCLRPAKSARSSPLSGFAACRISGGLSPCQCRGVEGMLGCLDRMQSKDIYDFSLQRTALGL